MSPGLPFRPSPTDPSERQLIAWNGHEGPALDEVAGFTVVDCERCRFRHIVPLPTEDELRAMYAHDYYAVEKPEYFERSREDLEWWELAYRERYELFERLLADDRRRILDIGSGPGFFLASGARRGWQPTGLEPSEQAVAHSRSLGLSIVPGFLTPRTASTLGTFDVVHLSEVLEHLRDPLASLELVESLLSPGGLVCVVVPNDYNPFQEAVRQLDGRGPWWVAPPHHVNYFTFETLRDFLKTRFTVVHEEATFPIDMFLLMGDNYVGDDEVGRLSHARRMRFELNLDRAGLAGLRQRLYRAFAGFGIGREILMLARKPELDG